MAAFGFLVIRAKSLSSTDLQGILHETDSEKARPFASHLVLRRRVFVSNAVDTCRWVVCGSRSDGLGYLGSRLDDIVETDARTTSDVSGSSDPPRMVFGVAVLLHHTQIKENGAVRPVRWPVAGEITKDAPMKIHFKNIRWQLPWGKAALAAVLALVAYPVFYLFTSSGYVASLLAGTTAVAMCIARSRYLNSLQARIAAVNDIKWDFELNGVNVGAISDAEYAAIRLSVFLDRRNYVAQFMNVGKVGARAIDSICIGVPIAMFWLVVGVALIYPETFSAIYNELQTAGPDAILASVKIAAKLIGLCAMLFVLVNAMFGARFGFTNHFSEATGTALRKHFRQAAEGNISLVRWVDGAPVFNDEMAYFRRSGK